VKNVFLYWKLEEEIYVHVLLGCDKNVPVKLKKALYGLKQSPQTWFGRFTIVMTSFRVQAKS